LTEKVAHLGMSRLFEDMGEGKEEGSYKEGA
jgi:hypothetical protein